MRVINLSRYRDKVAGCWTGKNIGGVFGAPFEGKRQVNHADFYVQNLSESPPANDDLDLQIVWLSAAERYGRQLNATILGEYWLSYIIPNWVEYGTAKANLRAGLQPPLSGVIDNTYKDSCGCFIRSEIWACLAPGHPDIAVRYAYEDSIVDHAGEGVYGEIFFAAVESAAFAESDSRKLIEIGLSYLPDDCIVSSVVRTAIECYENHIPFLETRNKIHNTAPGTFGIQGFKLDEINSEENEEMKIGQPGFDAPENVGYIIAGWLYGEGDFGKSLSFANSCGEDTDCTCATLGAILGILSGESGLPGKWKAPLNDKISTLSIDKTSDGIWIPDTVTELSDHVIRTMPQFLGQEYCDILSKDGLSIRCFSGDELFCEKTGAFLPLINDKGRASEQSIQELASLSPYVVRYAFPAFHMMVDYEGSCNFRSGEIRKVKVTLKNAWAMREQQWARITVYMPENVEMHTASSVELPLNNLYTSKAEAEFAFTLDQYTFPRLEFIVEVSLVGRHSSGAVKITLMRVA